MSLGRARIQTLLLLFAATTLIAAGALRTYSSSSQRKAIALIIDGQTVRDTLTTVGTATTRAYAGGAPVASRARIHRGEGRVAITYLDGPPQGAQVFREQERIWRGGPDPRVMLEAEPRSSRLNARLLRKNYVARVLGEENIAGRSARHVALRGRHSDAGLHLWLDKETHFPLRTVFTDPRGRAVSDTRYETIRYDTQPPPPGHRGPGAPVPRVRARETDLAEAARTVDFKLLRPSYLPWGFEPDSVHIHELRHRSEAVELRYTDGLLILAIIETKRPGRRGPGVGAGGRRGPGGRGRPGGGGPGGGGPGGGGPGGGGIPGRFRGLAQAFGPPVVREVGEVTVIVMGDASRDELGRVANGLN